MKENIKQPQIEEKENGKDKSVRQIIRDRLLFGFLKRDIKTHYEDLIEYNDELSYIEKSAKDTSYWKKKEKEAQEKVGETEKNIERLEKQISDTKEELGALTPDALVAEYSKIKGEIQLLNKKNSELKEKQDVINIREEWASIQKEIESVKMDKSVLKDLFPHLKIELEKRGFDILKLEINKYERELKTISMDIDELRFEPEKEGLLKANKMRKKELEKLIPELEAELEQKRGS